MKRPAKLCTECNAEEADCNRCCDCFGLVDPEVLRAPSSFVNIAFIIDCDLRNAEAKSYKRHKEGDHADQKSLQRIESNTDNPELEHQRCEDGEENQTYERSWRNADSLGTLWNSKVISRKVDVWAEPGAGVIKALQNGPNEIEEQCRTVENENG